MALEKKAAFFELDHLRITRDFRWIINGAIEPGAREMFRKQVAALVGVIGAHESAVSVMAKAPVNEVIRHKARHDFVLGGNQRQTAFGHRAAHVHDRDAQPFYNGRQFRRFYPGDRAVPFPIPEPRRCRVNPAPFLALNRPFVVLTHEFCHPRQKAATVRSGKIDQDGDLPPARLNDSFASRFLDFFHKQ